MEYYLKIQSTNVDLIFELARFGVLDILKFDDIMKIKDSSNKNVLHKFASNVEKFKYDIETFNYIVNFIFSYPNIETFTDNHGNNPIHYLAKSSVVEIMSHPLFNSSKNKYGATPYCYLLECAPLSKIKECFIYKEATKDLGDSKMPLDYLAKRVSRPTIKQVQNWGVPIFSSNPRRKIDWSDIDSYKKNNSLRYIFED